MNEGVGWFHYNSLGLNGLKNRAGNFSRAFLYAISVHLNFDRGTSVRLLNRVIAFNQEKHTERFRRTMYFVSSRVSFLVNIE